MKKKRPQRTELEEALFVLETRRDYAAAYKYFEAHLDTCPVSMYTMARAYCYGRGVKQDFDRGVELCRRAAEQGYEPAQEMLDWINKQREESVDRYTKEELATLRQSARKGCADAQLTLGEYYVYKHKTKLAILWLTRATEQSHPRATYLLGKCYEELAEEYEDNEEMDDKYYDEWIENYDRAEALFLKAAEAGDADAMMAAANCYESHEDYPKAIEWYKTAIEAGFEKTLIDDPADGIERCEKELNKVDVTTWLKSH